MVLASFTTKRPGGRSSVRREARTCQGSRIAATLRSAGTFAGARVLLI